MHSIDVVLYIHYISSSPVLHLLSGESKYCDCVPATDFDCDIVKASPGTIYTVYYCGTCFVGLAVRVRVCVDFKFITILSPNIRTHLDL